MASKTSFEFVQWYTYDGNFCCGIYCKDGRTYTTVLSDMYDLTFTSIEACKEWTDNFMAKEIEKHE